MALSFAHGAIQWLSTDAVNTVYTVSGLSFQPKAIRFYWVGLQNAADAISGAVHSRRGVGFSDGTTHRCVTSTDQDAAATSACTSVALSDCVAATVNNTPAVDGKLGTLTITSDGFTVESDDVPPVSITVFWEAWGGSDITNVTVGDIAEPNGTGDVNYTATGFASGTTDWALMTAGIQSVNAVGTPQNESSGLVIGFMGGGGGAGTEVMVVGAQDASSATADTDGLCRTGLVLGNIAVAGGDLTSSVSFVSVGTNIVTLNWATRVNTGRRNIYMAIRGGRWNSGSVTIDGATINATATVSGLPYAPVGACFIGRMSAQQSGTTSAIQDRISMGTATGTGSRRSMGVMSEDASTSGSSVMEISTTIQYDQCLAYPGPADTLVTCYDINSWNSDGFQLINDLAGGVASEWIGYLTFGDAPVAAPMNGPFDGLVLDGGQTLAGRALR